MEFLGLTSTDWLGIGRALAIMVGAAILAGIVRLLLDRVFYRLSRRTRTSFDDALVDAVRAPIFWLIMFVALQLALDQLTFLPQDWRANRADLMFVLYVFVAYLFLHKLISNMLAWYSREMASHTESSLDDHALPFLRRVLLIVLAVIAVIVVLSHFDVDVSALVTTLGIASLAIALAAQATLSDTISGFGIIADRTFSIGDRIEILELNTWGDVQDIGLRSTRILTRDNRMVIIPNSVISSSLVVNHSDPSTVYRVQTHIGIADGTDLETARNVMVEAVRSQDWVMTDKPIEALFIEYGDWALIFRVRCWIQHYVETRRIMDKLNSCLYDALHAEGIEMPSPTRTVYHRVDPEHRNGLVAVLRDAQAQD
jgi:small-conductance mechanosensitive channel